MSTIASGAFYLASPLAAVGHPPPMHTALRIPTIATPSAVETGALARSTRGYIIVDLPVISGTRRKSLDEVIGEEVKQRISEHPDGAPGISSLALADRLDATDDDLTPVPSSVSDAVIAAHEERISYLKQRLDTLRPGIADPSLLNDLRSRMRRAEAARRLAVVRACEIEADAVCRSRSQVAASDAPPVAKTVARSTAGSAPKAGARTARVASIMPLAAGRAKSSVANAGRRKLVGGETNLNLAHLAPISQKSGGLFGHSLKAAQTTIAASSRYVVKIDAARQSTAHRLAHARRSLATARMLLEPAPQPHVDSAVQITGLWRWPGSDTWSLADYRAARV